MLELPFAIPTSTISIITKATITGIVRITYNGSLNTYRRIKSMLLFELYLISYMERLEGTLEMVKPMTTSETSEWIKNYSTQILGYK